MLDSQNRSSSLVHPRFRLAEMRDVAAIVEIINAAFRVERFFIGRDRTDADSVRTLMATGQFILAEDSERLAGCVYVELRKERGYFGLLSVDPARQKSGLGTGLIAAAENYFREAGCRFSDMRIVNIRAELPPFYRRLGYVEISTSPFIAEAKPKLPCHFINMSKPLA